MNIAELSLVKSARAAGWRRCTRAGACVVIAAQLAWTPLMAGGTVGPASMTSPSRAAAKPTDAILKVMQAELTRATAGLEKSDPAPYYISYTVNDQDVFFLVGAYGSLLTDAGLKRRQADVVMRVGSPALDNTHGQARPSGMTSGALPLSDDPDAIGRVLWELTDREYK